MAVRLATLQRSTGVVLSSTIHDLTARAIASNGDATVITPGVSGWDVVRLKTAALDTKYAAATLANPVLQGVDDVLLIPLQYPELPKL
jgi:hypothetical protein